MRKPSFPLLLVVLAALVSLVSLASLLYFRSSVNDTPSKLPSPLAERSRPAPTVHASHSPAPGSQSADSERPRPQDLPSSSLLLDRIEAQVEQTLHDHTETRGHRVERTRILATSGTHRLIRLVERSEYLPTSQTFRQHPPIASVANRFILSASPDSSPAELEQLAQAVGASLSAIEPEDRLYRLSFPADADLATLPQTAETFAAFPDLVAWIEPDFLVATYATFPNDPLFDQQAALHNKPGNRAQNNDIDAPEAWAISNSAADLVIAVIDSGIRLTHEDLAPNLWKNPRETADGADSDGNGYIDDAHGINAIDGSGDVSDANGHGTHVAGIAAAAGNNGKGIAGVAWNAHIMPLRFIGADGTGATSDAIECIEYAIANGADIINNSWGGSGKSAALERVLKKASDAGILIATAAGNERNDLDEIPAYPAAYEIPNQIVVVAATDADTLARYSNSSPRLAHIAAPGRVLSAFNQDDSSYVELAGTSMASPHVAGALALLKAHLPSAAPEEIVTRLLDSAEIRPDFAERCISSGRLNLRRALLGESNAPENDHFANATEVTYAAGLFRGSTSRATSETQEPQAAPAAAGHSVWFRWQPGYAQRGIAILAPVGFPATIVAYRGDSLASLERLSASESSRSGDSASLSIDFQPNETYYLQIDSVGPGDGPFSLSLALNPQNDDFANAQALDGSTFSETGSNRAATSQASESTLHISASGATVWYRWTPSVSGAYFLQLSESTGRLFARVFTGNAVGSLQPVPATFEPHSEANQLFDAAKGQTYYFAVDSLSQLGHSFRIEGSFLGEPKLVSQPNDQVVALGDPASFTVSVFGLGAPVIQWFKDESPIPGANQPTLRIDSVTQQDLGSYQARVAISGYTLYTRKATLSKDGASIAFLRQPTAMSLLRGETIELSALLAAPSQNDRFQWLKDGQPLQGKTSPRLDIPSATENHSGFYQLKVTRDDATTLSNTAFVLVSKDSKHSGFAFANLPHTMRAHYVFEAVGDTYLGYDRTRIGFSRDGAGWQFAQIGANQIIKAKDAFIAGSHEGALRSKDLVNWEVIGTLSEEVYSVAYGNNTYLARTRDAIYRSTNGETWAKTISVPYNDIAEVAFGNGLFIATEAGKLHLSDDGVAWRQISSPADQGGKPRYADGYWWLYSRWESEPLHRSPDGETWEAVDLPVDSVRYVAFDPVEDRVYFIGQINDNASEWSDQANTYAYRIRGDEVEQIRHIDYGYDPAAPQIAILNGRALLALENTVAFLDTFQQTHIYEHPDRWWHQTELSFVNDEFIAGSGSVLYTSTDATNWKLAVSKSDEVPFGKFAFGNGIYVGYNHYGPSLTALKRHNQSFISIAFGGGVFVGLNHQGLFFSTDGRNWTPTETSTINSPTVVFGGGVFLVYNSDYVYRSTNGKDWTKVPASDNEGFHCIVYGGGAFYAFDSNQCYTSTDGRSWSKRGKLEIPEHSSAWVYDAYYVDGKVVAPYWDDYYFESTNGDNWRMKRVTAFSFGWDHRARHATDGKILLASSQIGIGILGKPNAAPLELSVTSPSRQIKANVGSVVEVDFLAQSLQSDISSVSLFVNGTLWKTLPPGQRRFEFPLSQAGDFLIDIQVTDATGNQASESLNISAAPLVHTTLPKGELWFYDLIFWRGAFYAAADGGKIYTSTDGVSWKGIQTPTLSRITHIEGNAHALVAAPQDDGILYSENGSHWLEVDSFRSDGLHKNDEVFVSGSANTPHISLNGRNWIAISAGDPFAPDSSFANAKPFLVNGTSYGSYLVTPYRPVIRLNNLNNAIKIGDQYLASGTYKAYRSEDLTTWTELDLGNSTIERLKKVGDLVFAQSYTYTPFVSGDGIEWFEISESIGTEIEQGPDGYYYSTLGVYDGDPTTYIARSIDGIHWTPYGTALNTGSYSYSVERLAASEQGVAASSESGHVSYTFMTESGIEYGASFDSFGFRGEIEVIGDSNEFALTDYFSYKLADDGAWERTETRIEESTAYANGFYVGDWHQGPVKSVDGENWTPFNLPSWLYDTVDYPSIDSLFTEGDDAVWIKVQTDFTNYTYAVLRSEDGENWSRVHLPESASNLHGLFKFKGHVYLHNGNPSEGAFLRSGDLFETWQSIFPSSHWNRQVAATADTLAIITGEGDGYNAIHLSSDGASFAKHVLPEAGYVNLHATGDAFYLTGSSVWKSANGKDWSLYLPYRLNASANRDQIYFYLDNLCFVQKVDTDLALHQASASAGEFSIGDTIPIELTLRNAGSAPLDWQNGARIRYTFHSQPNHWSSSPQLPSFSQNAPIPFNALTSNSSKSFTLQAKIPEGAPPGSYFLSAHIEGEVLAKDGNPSNDFHYETNIAGVTLPARTLTIGKAENGYVESPNKKAYARGEKVMLNAVPDFGYEFAGWSGDREYGEAALLVTLTENASLSPSFAKRLFNLKLAIDGHGSVSGLPESGLVPYGETLQLEATPAEGWIFIGWKGYGNSSSNSLSATVGRDLTLQARFGRLYRSWADQKYGNDEDRKAPSAPSPFPSLSNLEYFAFGIDFHDQLDDYSLGAELDGNYLVTRYALYQGLAEYQVTPVWSEDGQTWQSTRVSSSRISATDDLTVHEARIALPVGERPLFLSLRITEATLEQDPF